MIRSNASVLVALHNTSVADWHRRCRKNFFLADTSFSMTRKKVFVTCKTLSLSTESRSIVGLRWCLSLFWVFRKKNKKQRLVWEERTGECRTCIIYLFSVCIHKTFFSPCRWRVAFTFRIKNAILNDAKLERSANELVPKLLTIAQKRCGSLHFTGVRAQLLVNQNSIQLR